MNPRYLKVVSCMVLGLTILHGCTSTAPSRYALDTTRPDRPVGTRNSAVLDLRRLTIDAAYESKGLVYRQGETLYETDYDNEFLVLPARLITDRMRSWVIDAELCAGVLDSGSLLEPTHSLEGRITHLYRDDRDEKAPKAVMELKLYLVSHKQLGQAILLGKTYRQTEPASSPDPDAKADALVKAFDTCLVRILTELESDLKVTMH